MTRYTITDNSTGETVHGVERYELAETMRPWFADAPEDVRGDILDAITALERAVRSSEPTDALEAFLNVTITAEAGGANPGALARFPLPNHLGRETVAHAEHVKARRADHGPALALRTLADGIHMQALLIGPDGDSYAGPIVASLLRSLIDLLSTDTGGWDGGTVDAWARGVAAYIGESLD